ncbi:3-hydroxyacyl-CoA dehydrogenase [Geotalea daltonii FRC-32]|uniref:3-hydroxyacyl-CoA dehydrogenase n=1 Tax=Geotalea daltonii (strain DSM 22248 / JCM 15807 / FRC-32) TaxID=316067 RepID=B9M935_GEODF|nr:3-hydroxyacyl-CoA dehydrogenase family protein [Geotalea daltonii]ACM18593.1 3-hydroxyacyl-CoA dehydrogenase [Geotalea daltonii FRC-32]
MKFAILGTGIMGRGWITQCAMSGHEVHCHDASPQTLAGTVAGCEKLAATAAKKFKHDDPNFVSNAMGKIRVHNEKGAFIDAAKGCDVFLEVIFEDLKLKCSVLADYLPQLPPSVVFWSNSSSLDIDPMAQAGGRPDRSIVTHGMNPVPLMPGVEVVPGAKTSSETIEFTRQTLLNMKKAPFLAPNIPGFWVNRLLVPQMLDAVRLLEQGKITVEDGDTGLYTSLGHPQGTFKLHDFVTAPTMLRVALQMYQASNDPRMYPPLTLMRMVKNGEYGASSGKGFYDWSDPRNPKPLDMSKYVIGTAEEMLQPLA